MYSYRSVKYERFESIPLDSESEPDRSDDVCPGCGTVGNNDTCRCPGGHLTCRVCGTMWLWLPAVIYQQGTGSDQRWFKVGVRFYQHTEKKYGQPN